MFFTLRFVTITEHVVDGYERKRAVLGCPTVKNAQKGTTHDHEATTFKLTCSCNKHHDTVNTECAITLLEIQMENIRESDRIVEEELEKQCRLISKQKKVKPETAQKRRQKIARLQNHLASTTFSPLIRTPKFLRRRKTPNGQKVCIGLHVNKGSSCYARAKKYAEDILGRPLVW